MRLPVPYFVSYARRDSADVERFRSVLEPLLQSSARFQFGEWSDHHILPGEHWRAEMEQALARSRFGLLLVSPAFLASDFITQRELPPLLAKPMVVPVALQQILFDGTLDLKGLEDRQVFRDSKGRSFDQCRGHAGPPRFRARTVHQDRRAVGEEPMLTKSALRRTVPPVRERMGKSGAELDQLLELVAADGSANLADVLRALYPGAKREPALARLRQLRLEVKNAARAAGIILKLSGDRKTRTPAEARRVWFDGEDRLLEAAEEWVRPNLAGPERSPQDAVEVGPARLYVVYAEKDQADAKKLLEALRPHLTVAHIETWTHTDILPGETPETERARARTRCDLTIQFLSPEFLAARLDTERTARVLPVLLHELPHPPKDVAVFRCRGRSFDKSKPKDFALELFSKIEAALAKSSRMLEEELRALARHEAKFVDPSASSVSLLREIEPRRAREGTLRRPRVPGSLAHGSESAAVLRAAGRARHGQDHHRQGVRQAAVGPAAPRYRRTHPGLSRPPLCGRLRHRARPTSTKSWPAS